MATPRVDSACYGRYRPQKSAGESGNAVLDLSEGVSQGELRPAVGHR